MTDNEQKALEALLAAKSQLVTLGGDSRGDQSGDKIQAAVLDAVDGGIAALRGSFHSPIDPNTGIEYWPEHFV